MFPLPLTGKVPDVLRQWVLQPPSPPIRLELTEPTEPSQPGLGVGVGFEVELGWYAYLDEADPDRHHWTERWLVTRSDKLAQRHQARLTRQLTKAEAELARLNEQGFTSAAQLEQAAHKIISRPAIQGLLRIEVTETLTEQVRYRGPGRPGPNRPKEIVVSRRAHLSVSRHSAAIAEREQLAGWRIHVTNVPANQLSLTQAIRYYRAEFVVEHGMHRFKHGSLPVLPLFLQLPERICGLLLILLIALQLLTLLEFVAHSELARRQATLTGLVPGNPKMKTDHPSAERLLARFTGLHYLIEPTETGLRGRLVEELTPVQRHILDILGIPETIYALSDPVPLHNYPIST